MALVLIISDVLIGGVQVDQGTIRDNLDDATASHLVSALKARFATQSVVEKGNRRPTTAAEQRAELEEAAKGLFVHPSTITGSEPPKAA